MGRRVWHEGCGVWDVACGMRRMSDEVCGLWDEGCGIFCLYPTCVDSKCPEFYAESKQVGNLTFLLQPSKPGCSDRTPQGWEFVFKKPTYLCSQ